MSLSAINYYYTGIGLPTAGWISYNNFSGSGFNYFNGNSKSGIYNTGDISDFTILCSFQKANKNEGILFSNYSSGLLNNSGFALGITAGNRIYLESTDGNPVILESDIILGSKNAIGVTKIANSIYIDYFDFNSKNVESDNFTLSPNSFLNSNKWTLGGYSGAPSYFSGNYFNGAINEIAIFNFAARPSEISELFKGFYNDIIAGVPTINSGEVLSYGMSNIAYLDKLHPDNNIDLYLFYSSSDKTNLNKDGLFDRTVGEFFTQEQQAYSGANVYLNGIAQYGTATYNSQNFYNPTYTLSGDYLPSGQQFFSNGAYNGEDRLVYDSITGESVSYLTFSHIGSGSDTIIYCGHSGNSVFFNGMKIVENVDFIFNSADTMQFLANNPLYNGVTGELLILPKDNDKFTTYSGELLSLSLSGFARNTSLLWLNGVRQNLAEKYLEVSSLDLLVNSGVFTENKNIMFSVDNNFWQINS